MKRLLIALVVSFCLLPITIISQGKPAPIVVFIKAGRLVDVCAGFVLNNQGILIEGQRIKVVGALAEVLSPFRATRCMT